MSLKQTAQRLGLGRLALALWHQPVGRLRNCLREGGPLQQRRTERGRREMELAATRLPALTPADATHAPLELHLLTGRRFWYQSAFCLWSFALHAQRRIAPLVYDDGTLAEEQRAILAAIFPLARFVPRGETLLRLDEHLPAARFPVLRERWQHYPNIRKLTDIHTGSTGWKLVIDSDLLFFRRPSLLIKWLDKPARPLHAVDIENSYGYSRPLLESLAGAPLADFVNVGLCGLNSSELDWEKLEHWCRVLLEKEGASYYLEQALVAMLVASRECTVAPAASYVTLPRPPEALACDAVMHHYVAESKRWYFQSNWFRVLAAAS
jgi:hypothetical protein